MNGSKVPAFASVVSSLVLLWGVSCASSSTDGSTVAAPTTSASVSFEPADRSESPVIQQLAGLGPVFENVGDLVGLSDAVVVVEVAHLGGAQARPMDGSGGGPEFIMTPVTGRVIRTIDVPGPSIFTKDELVTWNAQGGTVGKIQQVGPGSGVPLVGETQLVFLAKVEFPGSSESEFVLVDAITIDGDGAVIARSDIDDSPLARLFTGQSVDNVVAQIERSKPSSVQPETGEIVGTETTIDTVPS